MQEEARPKALFIDDEPSLLAGLRRAMRPLRSMLDMEFACGGKQALAYLDSHPVDIVITDMRMPEIYGGDLLAIISKKFPNTVRFILSGQSEQESILKAVAVSHQYISKPCKVEDLGRAVELALNAQERILNQKVKNIVSVVKCFPILESTYNKLGVLLNQNNPESSLIAEVISKDICLSAQVLHLVNSDYFVSNTEFTDINQAIGVLGAKNLKSLVNIKGLFRPETSVNGLLNLENLASHSLAVAESAKTIAQLEGLSESEQQLAYISGFLHEIGRIILVSELPEEYKKVVDLVSNHNRSHFSAELEVFGCTHTEVGAYLLALWGMPYEIVEAVTFQGDPTLLQHNDFRILSILHAANALQDELLPICFECTHVNLNEKYFEDLKLTDSVQNWRKTALKSNGN